MDSGTLRVGPRKLYFSKLPWWFLCRPIFEAPCKPVKEEKEFEIYSECDGRLCFEQGTPTIDIIEKDPTDYSGNGLARRGAQGWRWSGFGRGDGRRRIQIMGPSTTFLASVSQTPEESNQKSEYVKFWCTGCTVACSSLLVTSQSPIDR